MALSTRSHVPIKCSKLRVARPCLAAPPRAENDVGKYLRDAIKAVFQTEQAKDLQWKATAFEGKISHDDHARLRKIYSAVKLAVPDEEVPKTLPEEPMSEDEPEEVKRYLQGAIEKVFNTKEETEPGKWHLTPYSGDISSQREVQRLIWVKNILRSHINKGNTEKK